MKSSVLLTIYGVVQGVGFRPFTARIAEEMGISGYVRNKGGIVEILLSAEQKAVDEYIHRLCVMKPFGAEIDRIDQTETAEWRTGDFEIIASQQDAGTPVLPADFSVCEACLAEMKDPDNRRYRNPFISCTSCGPRYSLMKQIPYDRENITMASFALCPSCREEYQNPTRRRHAQTISCHDCGPRLLWTGQNGQKAEKENALQQATSALKNGDIVAVKGIGGYQYLCSAYRRESVRRLRELKGRETKPFAVMFPDLETVCEMCAVSEREKRALMSSARPIVLLEKRKDCFDAEVGGKSRFIGAFLPNTPLHALLLSACGALIVTSANRSGEILCFTEEQIRAEQNPLLAGILWHTREIVTPLDDSVLHICGEHTKMIRRSRGYVPLPILLPQEAGCDMIATGADLKTAFCLIKGTYAYMSQYFGDMAQMSVQQTYRDTVDHMEKLFHIKPEKIACDLHPSYHTVRWAEKRNLPLIRVQHHHAHIASVMAEHRLQGTVLGFAFDGTGYGTDGTVWGGETLLCHGADFERVGSLMPILMAGGDRGAKEIRLSAYSYLYAADLSVEEEDYQMVKMALQNRVNTVRNSAMGRLFDAVSYLLSVAKVNSYEGEAPILLENEAVSAQKEVPYPLQLPVREDGIADTIVFIRQLMEGINAGVSVGRLALGFHHAIADMMVAFAERYREKTQTIALSGGVFANDLLSRLAEEKLKARGFQVFWNEQVPCNDGGIALGQAYISSMK